MNQAWHGLQSVDPATKSQTEVDVTKKSPGRRLPGLLANQDSINDSGSALVIFGLFAIRLMAVDGNLVPLDFAI